MAKQALLPQPIADTEVKILADDFVLRDRVVARGTMVHVPAADAEVLVAEGRAAWTVRVRALRERFAINRTLVAGEEMEVSEPVAARLWNDGSCEIVDRSKLRNPQALLAIPKPPRPREPEPEPYAGEKRLRVKTNRPLLVGRHNLEPGVHDIPESRALHIITEGAGELTPGQALTSAAVLVLVKLAEKVVPSILQSERPMLPPI